MPTTWFRCSGDSRSRGAVDKEAAMENIWWAVPAGIAVAGIAWYVLRSARRRSDRSELKEQVQAWEDEGGNVPEVPTVSPRVPPPGGRP